MDTGNQFFGTERIGKLMGQYAVPCIILPIFLGLDGLVWSFPAADLLTFIIAIFFIRQTYRELSDTTTDVLKGEN